MGFERFFSEEEPVGTREQLAQRFGSDVWLPAPWPSEFGPPRLSLVRNPLGHESYQTTGASQRLGVLVIVGMRRHPGGQYLTQEMRVVPAMPRPCHVAEFDEGVHVVVEPPDLVVHVAGTLRLAHALEVARSLRKVATEDG